MISEIRMRACSPGDEEALSLIGQATFLETFAGALEGWNILPHCASAHSVDCYRSWLIDSSHKLWLAEINPGNTPIGYMVVSPAQLPRPDISDRGS